MTATDPLLADRRSWSSNLPIRTFRRVNQDVLHPLSICLHPVHFTYPACRTLLTTDRSIHYVGLNICAAQIPSGSRRCWLQFGSSSPGFVDVAQHRGKAMFGSWLKHAEHIWKMNCDLQWSLHSPARLHCLAVCVLTCLLGFLHNFSMLYFTLHVLLLSLSTWKLDSKGT